MNIDPNNQPLNQSSLPNSQASNPQVDVYSRPETAPNEPATSQKPNPGPTRLNPESSFNQAQSSSERSYTQTQPKPESTATNQDQNQDQPRPNQDQRQYADYFQDIQKPMIEEEVISWNAPSRPFKKRNRQYHTTVITITLLLSLILFFAGQVLTIAVVIAVAFLAYIMSTIPPHSIKNSFTTYGVRSEDNLYYWEELGRFWFEIKHDQKVLYMEVARFPHRLTLLLGNENEELVSEILSEVLLQQKPPLTSAEKFAEWLKKKVPLDLDS